MLTISIEMNIGQDAWNWWDACNKISHGVDWKNKIDPSWHPKLIGRTQKEAEKFLIPYLSGFYAENDTKDYIQELKAGFDRISEDLFSAMEKVTKHPIFRNDFICFLTSFPRYPYKYPEGFVWIAYKGSVDDQIHTFIHELLHFQFFAYYGEMVWEKIGAEKHGILKEAMTVIINNEFRHITPVQDSGYKIHKELRAELLKEWHKTRDMDKFMEGAIEIMSLSNINPQATF